MNGQSVYIDPIVQRRAYLESEASFSRTGIFAVSSDFFNPIACRGRNAEEPLGR